MFSLCFSIFRYHALSNRSLGSAAKRFRVAALASGLHPLNLLISHLAGFVGFEVENYPCQWALFVRRAEKNEPLSLASCDVLSQ